MTFEDDVVKRLATLPREDAAIAPEAARNEAGSMAKRGLATYGKDPRGQGPAQALQLYVEALELDPSCKAAYEGVGRLVLGRATSSQPAVEAGLRLVEVGLKRLPNDAELRDIQKKLRAQLPSGPAEPALAAKARPAPKTPQAVTLAAGKPSRSCTYCGSPIPAGSDSCRSCQMSGEVLRPGGPVPQPRSPLALILGVLAVVAVAVVAGVLVVLKMRRGG